MTNTNQDCPSSKIALRVPIDPSCQHGDLAFIEHVLDVLSESRSGRPRAFRLELQASPAWISDTTIDRPDRFYDLTTRLRMHAQRFLSVAGPVCDGIEGPSLTPVASKTTTAASGPVSAADFRLQMPLCSSLPLPRGSPRSPTEIHLLPSITT